jgi:hypothetical protein
MQIRFPQAGPTSTFNTQIMKFTRVLEDRLPSTASGYRFWMQKVASIFGYPAIFLPLFMVKPICPTDFLPFSTPKLESAKRFHLAGAKKTRTH